MGYHMKLKTIIKNSDSNVIAYTFTKDEARIKFPQRLEENTYRFCQLVTDFLNNEKQVISLRGCVLIEDGKFKMRLKNPSGKKVMYTIIGDGENIIDIKSEQLCKT